jgi:hypothetical protein
MTGLADSNPRSTPITQPQRILLDAAMNALGDCGRKLREDGWDATLTVHTIPTLHVALSVQINTGPTPVEAA